MLRLCLVLAGLVLAEVGFRIWLAARGESYDAAATASSLRRRVHELDDGTFLERANRDEHDDLRPTVAGRVPHPFFGWQTLRGRADVEKRLREAAELPENAYVIWIVGGSVAGVFGGRGTGADRLLELLADDPRFDGRELISHNYARAAFKQPQQLTEVAYLLSLGLRPDAVINIDGFNEVAAGNMNAESGSHPVYPSILQWGGIVLPHDEYPALEKNRRQLLRTRGRARGIGEFVLDRGLYRSSVIGWWTDRLLGYWHWKCLRMNSDYARTILDYGSSDILAGPSENGRSSWDAIVTIWAESSRSLHAICKDRGIYYLHVLQPTLHDAGSKPLTEAEVRSSELMDYASEGARSGYPLLRAAAAELTDAGVVFVDGSNAFEGVTETLYYDGCHFGPEGNVLLAGVIAAAFLEHFEL